jgi:hypothetical protein
VTVADSHTLGWDTAARRTVAGGTGGAAVFACPDCDLAGTVYVDPGDALSQLVKLLTVAHRDGVVVVSAAVQRTP